MAEGEEIEFEQRPSGHLALTATSDDLVSATSGAQAPPPPAPEPQGEEREGEPKKAGEAKKEEKKKLVNGLNNAVEMMAKYTDIVVETNGENVVWLGSEEDAELFREIKVWRKENPESTVEEALKHFVTDREGGLGTKADALAKVAYNSRDVDYVIKFEDRGRFGNIRVAWERKLVKAGLVLELESEFDPKETFVKVFTPFSVMAREAERKSLRMPLCAEADPYKRQRQEQEQRDREAGILPPGGEGAPPEGEEEEAHGPSTLGPRPSGMEDVNLPTPEGAKGKAPSEPGRRRRRRRSLWAEVRTFFSLNEHMAPGASGRFSLEDIGEFMGGDDLVACEGTSPKERLVLEFFPRSKRNLLTYYLITKIFLTPVELREIDNPYVQTQHSFGINHALKHGAYTHFFPLHDGSHSTKHRKKNLRAWLKSRWCLSPFSFQPLDTVRDYFGEKIALYFAFLGFYTVWLWPAALAGLLSFFYGISYAVSQTKLQLTLDSVTELDTIQRSTGRVFDNPATIPFAAFMCVWATLFVEFWKRKNSFLAYWWDTMNYEQSEMPRPEWYGTKVRVSPITGKKEYYYPEQVRNAKMAASCVCISVAIIIILFSVMCTVVYTAWATNYFGECFIPDVERAYCVELLSEYRGVTLNATCSDPCYSIPDRPTCEAGTFELDGATFQSCLWFDLAGDEPRNPGNLTGLCAPGCETVPRGIPCTADPADPVREIRPSCGWRDKYMISDITTSLFNLFVIVIMNKIFEYAAYVLNDWENHKTLTLWEDSLITKTFFFQFLNSYTTLFYIAFFKGTVANKIFGRQDLRDTCEYGSCFNEVMIQLAIVFVGKQVINQFIEIALPWLKKSLRGKLDERQARNLQLRYEEIQQAKAAKDPHATPPQWVQDQNLDSYQSVLFDDYNEMALQFGFITLFVAAFPLAPFFALLNNLVEIRTDSYKLIVSHQRPPALQAKDIGNWQTILNVLGIMAVITNAFMIAFTSDWVTQTLEELSIEHSWREILAGRLVIVLVFEHVVIGLKVLCSLLVPDTPAPVKLAIDRENYLARLALEGITEEEDADGEVDLMNNLFSDVIHNVRRAQDSTNAHINAWSKK